MEKSGTGWTKCIKKCKGEGESPVRSGASWMGPVNLKWLYHGRQLHTGSDFPREFINIVSFQVASYPPQNLISFVKVAVI